MKSKLIRIDFFYLHAVFNLRHEFYMGTKSVYSQV